MTTNLLDDMKIQLPPDRVQRIGTLLNETPDATQNAIDGVLPTLLAGVLRFSATGSGATQLVEVLTNGDYGNVLNNLSGLSDPGNTAEKMMRSGRNILNMVFADKLPAVGALIAKSSGMKNTATSSLLSLAAPVVLGVIARARAAQRLDAVGLSSLLMAQRQSVSRLAPAGLETILDLHSVTMREAEHVDPPAATATNDKALLTKDRRMTRGIRRPWGWLSIGLIALGVFYWQWGGGTAVNLALPVVPAPTATPDLVFPVPAPNVTLPGGPSLFLKEGSPAYHLTMFLADTRNEAVPQVFVFDQVNFAAGTAALTPDSEQTVKELSLILAAYPATDVQLHGYTDGMGDTRADYKLAWERAETIKLALIKSGIAAPRLATSGNGQEHPLTFSNMEDERGNNPGLTVIVVRK
ncbi:MAG: DUF937 domain-containing protein [Candidatus Binatia bacterium]